MRVGIWLSDDLVLQENVVAAEEFLPKDLEFTWEPEGAPAQYALTIFVEWDDPRGDATYLFGVELP